MKSIKSAGSASYSTGNITIFKAQKMYSKDVFIPFQQTALQINCEMLVTRVPNLWFQGSLLAPKPGSASSKGHVQ